MKVDPKTGDVTMEWRDRRAIVLDRAVYVCEVCKAVPATEVDHIWPKSMGGPDDLDNLQATCLPCNRSKGGTAYVKDLTVQTSWWTEKYHVARASTSLHAAARYDKIRRLLLADRADPEGAYDASSEADVESLLVVTRWVLGDRFVVTAADADPAEVAEVEA